MHLFDDHEQETRAQNSLDPAIDAIVKLSEQESLLPNGIGSTAPLPDFIKPLPDNLDDGDIQYLCRKGALSLPSGGMRRLILCRYAEFVHPFLPILDLVEFLTIVGGKKEGKISLLLYQAIMSAGLMFVEKERIIEAGYSSKLAARQIFYSRAKVRVYTSTLSSIDTDWNKLLFDLDAEQDRTVSCQAALLLSSWYTKNQLKDPMHWVGVAINQALSLELHKEEVNARADARTRRLRRRLWWSALMREFVVNLGMGRPPRIRPQGIAMLDMDDFVFEELPEDVDCVDLQFFSIWKNRVQRQLAAACIELAKLSLCICHVLIALQHDDESYSARENRNREIANCSEELKTWRRELPDNLRCNASAMLTAETLTRPLHVNVATMHLVYWTTISALHKPEALSLGWVPAEGHSPKDERDRVNEKIREVRKAAREISEIDGTLFKLGWTQYLPAISVATTGAAVIVHFLDAMSKDSGLRSASVKGLQQCIDVLRVLGDANYSAATTLKFVEGAAARFAEISSETNAHAKGGPRVMRNGHTGTSTPVLTVPAPTDPPKNETATRNDEQPDWNGDVENPDSILETGESYLLPDMDSFFGVGSDDLLWEPWAEVRNATLASDFNWPSV